MSDETIKWKIKVLYKVINRMNSIKKNANELNTCIQNIQPVLNQNLKINNEPFLKNTIDNNSKELKTTTETISNKIIPSLYYSISKLEKELEG